MNEKFPHGGQKLIHHREQARSYSWGGNVCKKLVGCQATFAGKPRAYRKSEAERRTLLILTTHQAER
jgi:hypothetical protein